MEARGSLPLLRGRREALGKLGRWGLVVGGEARTETLCQALAICEGWQREIMKCRTAAVESVPAQMFASASALIKETYLAAFFLLIIIKKILLLYVATWPYKDCSVLQKR